MAIAAEEGNKSGIFWINDTSDEDQPMVFVPGVSRKPGLRLGSGCTEEGKSKVQMGLGHERGTRRGQSQQSSRSALSSVGKSSTKTTPSTRPDSAKARSPAPTHRPPEDPLGSPQTAPVKTKPSLKDLCPEDKRRIASLIQELARVSEEKEESVQKLKDEHETFERKILELEQQNQHIVHEREGLRQQYRECQELLSLYQQYLTQQQDKLNQSIAELNQARSHTKASRSERSTHRSRSAKAGTLEGSYLDLPSPRDTPSTGAPAAAVPMAHARSLLANHGRCPPATPTAPLSSTGSSVSDRKPRSAARPRREHCSCSHAQPGPVASAPQGPDRGAEEGEQRGGEVAGGSAAPPPGWEDWEERRRRLVEQKRQLEEERERLQQRLALQEDRLSQQLQETRLLNDGLQQTDTAGLEKHLPNGGLLNQPPLVNGYGHTHSDERGNASHLAVAAEVLLAGDTNTVPPKHMFSQEPPLLTKKDMATSPAVPQSTLLMPSSAPTMPSCLPCTPRQPRRASPNSSLIELLEIFSPVSLMEVPGPRGPARALRPQRHGLLTPAARSCLPPQDPEESQILEDIFFIC
ncbi:protein hinderin isoform X1 [Clupea harengus]|uniref:Protein hinderin isoform X1 n=1 Tax=Clupea harengus TaxID=7950 RepID=A0A6P3W1D9_CLUHA|nr:protein hinderin isoform X1 [Clupea harengus]